MLRLAALLLLLGTAASAAPLPRLSIDRAQVSVSGLSSGGYLATQLHVAYSSVFRRGAGIVAAGPWFCAEGSVALATGRCLTRDGAPPVDALIERAKRWSARGELDPLASLAASHVYVFSGSKDTRVVPALGADLARWYGAFVPAAQLLHRRDVPAGHAMVTEDFGSACDAHALPFINDCDLDLAGEILKHLHGPLAPRNEGAPAGRYLAFDQRAFIADGRGMGDEGRLYVPAACESGPCGVHVVLHGCGQNVELIGEDYVRRTGYARWADTNRLVLLFPQTSRDAINACWDWWGYTGADYAKKAAPQMGAIVAMVEHLASVAAPCRRALNGVHAWSGRALWDSVFGTTRAAGSGQQLGAWWQSSALRESPRGYFTVAGDAC